MPTYTKRLFSASTNGQPILIGSTTTTIHTSINNATDFDEVWIWAQNTSASAVNLTIQWGGTADPANAVKLQMAASSGSYLLVPGWILNNSLVVSAVAATTSVISVTGFVNRITA